MLRQRLMMARAGAGDALQAWIDQVNALNPVAFYRLEETSGTTATDATANGNDGTHNGGVTVGASPILPAGGDAAASYDGTDDYTSLPVYLWSTAWSVGFWMVAPDQDGGWWWSEGNSAGGDPLLGLTSGQASQGQDTSKLRFFLRGNSSTALINALATVSTLDGATEHYYGLSYDNGSWTFYIDGSADVSGSISHPSITFDRAALAAVIRDTVVGNGDCVIDEAHLHTSALTAQNWADLYAAATG